MLLVAAVPVAGCSGSTTLHVDLRTDLRAGVELWSAVVEVYRGEDPLVVSGPPQSTHSRIISIGEEVSAGVRVADLPLGEGPWILNVRLYAGAAEIGSRIVQVQHTGEQTVTAVITRRCVALDCTGASTPQACRAGLCVDPSCTPETTDMCPGSECETDEQCTSAGCVRGVCLAGECGAVPDDTLCGVGGRCDFSLGCVAGMLGEDGGVLDGSVQDASLPDAGVDAGRDAGGDAGEDGGCTPESNADFCARVSATCGSQSADDVCGAPRTVDCGGCTSSARCALGGCVACAGGGACATTSSSRFEAAELDTSVRGHEGWTVGETCGRAYDQEVVDDGTGNRVLRISNAISTDCFDQVSSPCPAGAPSGIPNLLSMSMPGLFAGESSTGATYRRFVSQFRFRSATSAAQSGLQIEVNAMTGGPDRQSAVVIRDTGAGFDVEGVSATFFSGISYDEWHTLRVELAFVEGDNNDVVEVFVDGVRSPTTETSFEELFRTTEPAKGNVPVQCIQLRATLPDVPALRGEGLWIDDVQTWLEGAP